MHAWYALLYQNANERAYLVSVSLLSICQSLLAHIIHMSNCVCTSFHYVLHWMLANLLLHIIIITFQIALKYQGYYNYLYTCIMQLRNKIN